VDRDGNNLFGFAVCGADKQWHWAKGAIQKDTVVLTCDGVKDPVTVRYAWADCPIATPLYNSAGLPAVPFQIELKP
jgi:sialate O-acetylesterase